MPTYVLVHDVGTTSSKTCLYRCDGVLELIGTAIEEYPLYVMDNGGVEQNPDDWWQAICTATRRVLSKTDIAPSAIEGMAFCAQMQGFVPVDAQGKAVYRAMSYLDTRGTAQLQRYLKNGMLKIQGMNARRLLRALQITGGASASAKDPVWKYLWLREHQPDAFNAMHKWLDVKDYLVLRATGAFTMGYDSAHVTFLFDTRPEKLVWHEGLLQTYDVNPDHLPQPVHATAIAGTLTSQAAEELGLVAGTPVFGGGGDLSMISLGAGTFDTNTSHIYLGTSGWVVTTVDHRLTDLQGMIASILGAIPGKYNYIAEQETSGRCLQWVRDHLALDEIGVYLESKLVTDKESEYQTLYDYLNTIVEQVEAGAGGVIFTPWLHGNRSPFEDPYARGMFFNISLETQKRDLIRAVLEGDAYHKRWLLETIEKKLPYNASLRLVGGGARSAAWSQILADVIGREIEVVENPENAGAAGTALVCGAGLGVLDLANLKDIVRVARCFAPRSEVQAVYDKGYRVYRQLYAQNKKLFREMNA